LFIILALTLLIGAGIFTIKNKAYASCPWFGCWGHSTFIQEQNAVENNQKRLSSVEPLPRLTDSLERKNLIKRAQTFNNPNKISYIYLYSFGKLIMYDTVKGKVSSVDSSLTAQSQVLNATGQQVDQENSCGSSGCPVVPAPAVDGSYGTNGNAIFYYNESGVYREWNGQYILSDQPFTLSNQPDLVKQVK